MLVPQLSFNDGDDHFLAGWLVAQDHCQITHNAVLTGEIQRIIQAFIS